MSRPRLLDQPRIGSLCSGYGGLDMGLQAVVGGEVAWHCEYDAAPSKILAHHWPDIHNYGDVTALPLSHMEHVDWITAGYPCQPFSHAGLRKGTDDPRHLWPHILIAIGALRPGHVLLENVAGHLTLGFADVLGDLAALGYDATWGVVRASDAGAPHQRARIFVVATDTRGERHGRRQDGRALDSLDSLNESEARERQRPRQESGDRSAPCDSAIFGLKRGGDARQRRDGSPDTSVPVTDPASYEGWVSAGDGVASTDANGCGQEFVRGKQRVERDPDGRSGEDIAWGDYEPAIRRWEYVTGRPAPRPTETTVRRRNLRLPVGMRGSLRGYDPRLGGYPSERLSPLLVEWMQGLPAGHVTDVEISRTDKLKALGNGVVPQQCALAVSTLLPVSASLAGVS